MSNLEKEKELKKMNFKINIVIYMLIWNSVSLLMIRRSINRLLEVMGSMTEVMSENHSILDSLIKLYESLAR